MNRRTFVTGSVASVALLPALRASALDAEIVENPIFRALQLLPIRSGPDGSDFHTTFGSNLTLQRDVWPENPDMYWDPRGEDYQSLFGFDTSALDLSSRQQDLEAWIMRSERYSPASALQTLESRGWELVDDDLTLLHFTGSEDDRSELVASMNQIGDIIGDGIWDWIALPTEDTIILGAEETIVQQSADVAKHGTEMQSMDSALAGLGEILPTDTYFLGMLPRQRLPIESSAMAFISRSWTGDAPIIQSVGMQLESERHVEPMIQTVEERLGSETSSITGEIYGNSIEIHHTEAIDETLRMDFVVTSSEWEVHRALLLDDLGMLPLEAEPT